MDSENNGLERLLINSKGFVFFTGKGNGGKSRFSRDLKDLWIKHYDDGIIFWSNEDDPTQIPTDPDFIKYKDYVKVC